MEKIAIVTLNGYYNYGNRLQNYALQETLKKFGFECETLINKTITNKQEEANKKKISSFLNKSFYDKVWVIYSKIKKNKLNEIKGKREAIFKEFTFKYINESSNIIEKNNISSEIVEKYKYFIAGSDQVWNPNDPTVSEVNFLTFAPMNKRISYAASFGVSNIPDKYKVDYKEWIEGIDRISVRENEGAQIIKQLTGRDSQVVVDPTMLITKEKWLNIAKESKSKPKGDYILTYFLGEISKDVQSKIKKISNKYNLEVVNLASIRQKDHYITGPSEFIDYINSAKLFITDSFHGCVFSLLLDTNFIVCDRSSNDKTKDMGARIETFLKKFKLDNRKFTNIDDEGILNYDYTMAKSILNIERKTANEFLKSALKR